MAAVTIFRDFGALENKVCHCFHFFPMYLPRSDSTRCHYGNYRYARFYCHFLNCFGFVFIGLFSSLPLLFSIDFITIFSVVFVLLFFFFWFVCFWFAVLMMFLYSTLYLYKIVLSCWSLSHLEEFL